jgi:hypothetical protein
VHPDEIKDSDLLICALGPLFVALGLYVSAYFLLVQPKSKTASFSPTGITVTVRPDYRGVPPGIFGPMNYLDRTLLRPRLWLICWSVQQPAKP